MNYHPNNEAVALISLETMMLPAPCWERYEYIIIYGLKKEMHTIRIFYLVGSAQCKH